MAASSNDRSNRLSIKLPGKDQFWLCNSQLRVSILFQKWTSTHRYCHSVVCLFFCGFSMTPAIQLSYKTSTEPDRARPHVPVMWSIWLGWKEKGTETGTESGSLIALTAGNEPLNEVWGNFATTTRGRRKACSVRPITAFNQMGRQAENDSLGLGGFQRRPQVAGASLNLLAWQPQCSFFPNSTFTASPKLSSYKKICLIYFCSSGGLPLPPTHLLILTLPPSGCVFTIGMFSRFSQSATWCFCFSS